MQDNGANSSVFRSNAWLNAWLEVYGRDPRIEILDLAGSGTPQALLYRSPAKIKSTLPIRQLSLVGCPSQLISSPRSEYNSIHSLMCSVGGSNALGELLRSISWGQCLLPDVAAAETEVQRLSELCDQLGARLVIANSEFSYGVSNGKFSQYLAQLKSSARSRIYNKRDKLAKFGELELIKVPVEQQDIFFDALNEFHAGRWGKPCYSRETRTFLKLFMEQLQAGGGQAILSELRVGDILAGVLYDVVWNGVRYNLQSGYAVGQFGNVGIGYLHLGFAIEEALNDGNSYDFLAGRGQMQDYKAEISNVRTMLQSYAIERGVIKSLRALRDYCARTVSQN